MSWYFLTICKLFISHNWTIPQSHFRLACRRLLIFILFPYRLCLIRFFLIHYHSPLSLIPDPKFHVHMPHSFPPTIAFKSFWWCVIDGLVLGGSTTILSFPFSQTLEFWIKNLIQAEQYYTCMTGIIGKCGCDASFFLHPIIDKNSIYKYFKYQLYKNKLKMTTPSRKLWQLS